MGYVTMEDHAEPLKGGTCSGLGCVRQAVVRRPSLRPRPLVASRESRDSVANLWASTSLRSPNSRGGGSSLGINGKCKREKMLNVMGKGKGEKGKRELIFCFWPPTSLQMPQCAQRPRPWSCTSSFKSIFFYQIKSSRKKMLI